MVNAFQKLHELGQSVWCDQLSRGMIRSGELQRWIDLGVTGVTSNPTIFMKAVTGSDEYDASLQKLLAEGQHELAVYEGLVLPDIVDAADLLRPIYNQTKGSDGYVSLEVNPHLAYDTDATVAEARRLFAALDRPNVFIKVPATEEGIPAIEALIAEGINVNITLIFSIAAYEKVMQAYLNGLKRLDAAGGDLASVASVASFFVSRVDSLVDKLLMERTRHAGNQDLRGAAATANGRLAYARFEQVFREDDEFKRLAARGARVQRPVWASTSTKNPDYPATKYVDTLIGPDTINTAPPQTLEAALREARPAVTIRDDLSGARALFEQLERIGIHMETITEKLRVDGVKLFADSFDQLLASLTDKTQQVRAAG